MGNIQFNSGSILMRHGPISMHPDCCCTGDEEPVGSVDCDEQCSHCPELDHGGNYATTYYKISLSNLNGNDCCFQIDINVPNDLYYCAQYDSTHPEDDLWSELEIRREPGTDECFWGGDNYNWFAGNRQRARVDEGPCDGCPDLPLYAYAVGVSVYFWISSGPTANLIVNYPDAGWQGNNVSVGCLFFGSVAITDCCENLTIQNVTACNTLIAISTLPDFIQTQLIADNPFTVTHLYMMAKNGQASVKPRRV